MAEKSNLDPEGDLSISQKRLNLLEGQINKVSGYFEGDNGLWAKIAKLETQTGEIARSMLTVKHAFWTVVTVAGGVIVACFSLVAHILLKKI